ncbi:hypothetical protein F4824DRAFT_516980 [Ustulina deusta]|nr:hypothetical protein F4824DRAFT_516980 [Ustulina deusta]
MIDSTIVDSLADEFCCHICLNLMEDPRAACEWGHTFCRRCLQYLIWQNLADNRRLSCPTCRALFTPDVVDNPILAGNETTLRKLRTADHATDHAAAYSTDYTTDYTPDYSTDYTTDYTAEYTAEYTTDYATDSSHSVWRPQWKSTTRQNPGTSDSGMDGHGAGVPRVADHSPLSWGLPHSSDASAGS